MYKATVIKLVGNEITIGRCKSCNRIIDESFRGYICLYCDQPLFLKKEKLQPVTIQITTNDLMEENWIEKRIREEQKKHPTLDWIKIASLKIMNTINQTQDQIKSRAKLNKGVYSIGADDLYKIFHGNSYIKCKTKSCLREVKTKGDFCGRCRGE